MSTDNYNGIIVTSAIQLLVYELRQAVKMNLTHFFLFLNFGIWDTHSCVPKPQSYAYMTQRLVTSLSSLRRLS